MNINYSIKFKSDCEWKMEKHHFHEDVEILLSLTDAGTFFANGKLYPIRKGSLIISENTVLHKTIADECDVYERYILHFPKIALKSISTEQTNISSIIGKGIQCIQLDCTEIFDITDILDKLRSNDCDGFGCDLKKDMHFIEFIIKVCELMDNKENVKFLENSGFNKAVPILDYIHGHLNENLNLDVLAQKFYMSKFHLSRIFKTYTGITIIEYIINCRVLKARELLRSGYSVQNSGELAGFNNNAHFIRTFGKLSGETPGKYMRKYRDGNKE